MKQQFDTEKKPFWWLGVIPAAISFVLMFFALPVEVLAVGIASLLLNFRHRAANRVWFAVGLTVLSMLGAVCFLAILIWVASGNRGDSGYWFIRLFF